MAPALLSLLLLGHNPDTSYVRVKISPERIETRLTYDIFTLLKITLLDDNADGQLQRTELANHAPQIAEFLRSKIGLAVSEDDDDADLGDFPRLPLAARCRRGNSGRRLSLGQRPGAFRFSPRAIRAACRSRPIAFGFFGRFSDRHTVLGLFECQDDKYEITFTNLEDSFEYQHRLRAHQAADGAAAPRALWRFFKLGVEHIFLGYDHICFLIALIVVSKFREIVKIVTSFTIAHSITLILATLDRRAARHADWWKPASPPRSSMSRSENLWVKDTRHRWRLTFFFGLVHGFGFANVLREMGLPSVGLCAACCPSTSASIRPARHRHLPVAAGLRPEPLEARPRCRHGHFYFARPFGTAWFIDRASTLS